jgi:hypothetical protein
VLTYFGSRNSRQLHEEENDYCHTEETRRKVRLEDQNPGFGLTLIRRIHTPSSEKLDSPANRKRKESRLLRMSINPSRGI